MQDKNINKARLLALQQELISCKQAGVEATNTVDLDQSRLGRLSRMDALQGQAMSQALNQRREIELQKVSSALQRVESGTYGYCVKCSEEISPKRLEQNPSTPLCFECAEKRERGE